MKKITKSVVLALVAALLLFGCKNPTAWIGANPEPDDIPFESGKYISATGTSEGIKITFKDNVSIKAYYAISVDGIPIRIDISEEDEKNNRKTYIFPFAEEGKRYVVTYDGELTVDGVLMEVKDSVECVAGGGLRYTDYLNIDSLDNYTLTVSYKGSNYPDIFTGEFKPGFTKNDVMKEPIFKDFTFGYTVVLGDVYWTWAHDVTWNNSIFDEDALAEGFKFVSGENSKVPTEQDWKKCAYKYAAYATPSFVLNDYSDTTFTVKKDLWSEQKTYNPSAGVEINPNGQYIRVEGVSDGIKITFADDVRIKAYKSISISGIPIRIDTSAEDEKNNRKTYIFPFAEKGKTYVVTYDGELTVNGVDKPVKESVECIAGGGLRYTDYLNIDSLDNCTLTVSYNGPNHPGGMFSGEFKPRFTKNDVIKNDSIFSDFRFGYAVVLGELDWEHTEYWSWAHDVTTWGDSNIDELALSKGFDFVSSGDCKEPTEYDWKVYDYKYAAYVTPIFNLKNYPDTTFTVQKALWSAQKTYDPSAGVETKPNGKYITAESTDKGIKITVINDAFEFRNCSFVGMDDGVEIPIKLADTYGDAREFVFPFTESGKKYYITVSGFEVNGDMWYSKEETVSCVAGGGIDYKQYVDLFSDSVLSINYMNSYMYDEQIGSCFEIKLTNCKIPNPLRQNIDTLRFGYGVLFRENYYNSYYNICNFDFDQNEAYESVVPSWVTEEEWSRYGYQYTGYMTPYLTLRDYQNTTFELPTVWDKQKTYTPSN